jgi:hypothetical protein
VCLITNTSDEAEKRGWEVYIFDSMDVVIKGEGDLTDLVRILKNNLK